MKVTWSEAGAAREAEWRSEGGSFPPKRVELADDTTKATVAFRQTCEGSSLLYRGDHRNARQLLSAMARRVDERRKPIPDHDLLAAFRAHRQQQSMAHQVLSKVLVELDAEYRLVLKNAPDVAEACREAWAPVEGPSVTSLRELQGMVGAHEWRKKGVEVPALQGRVHPHYGVFAPIRGEYVDLVAQAPLPSRELAFDVGTGTGVLALMLARRGVARVVATDCEARAVACARENVERFGMTGQVQVQEGDLFPEGRAPLVVFNPPWVPEKPRSPIERGIFDPDGALARRYIEGLAAHLTPGGEGWLILSDLAELIGLRSPGWVAQVASGAGLRIVAEHVATPTHRKAKDEQDPLFAARSRERTILYRLAA